MKIAIISDIHGNLEALKETFLDIENLSEQEKNRIEWNQSLITKEDREYLIKLPFSYEFYMSGSLVRLFHATPRENDKAVINVDSIETKYQMFLPSEKTLSQNIADVIIYGHIHHPYMDKIYGGKI